MLTKAQVEVLSMLEDDYSHVASDDELWAVLQRVDSPMQLHYLPEILNWDSGWTTEIMGWILDHPLCDAGTALSIYWLNEPEFWKKSESEGNIPPWGAEGYALHRNCESLYLSGKFSRGAIRFNPRDGAYLPKDARHESDAQLRIPEPLKIATPGADVPEYWAWRRESAV